MLDDCSTLAGKEHGEALGIAMCMYGREDESDALTTQLIHDKVRLIGLGLGLGLGLR